MAMIYFCRNCSAVIPDEEEITNEVEAPCGNCGTTSRLIPGHFDEEDTKAFWLAYQNV